MSGGRGGLRAAARARAGGGVVSDIEVAALLRLASALSWRDRERCLAVVDETRRALPPRR